MADINVKLKAQEKINVKLKPAQGIKVGLSKVYVFDESMEDKTFVFEQAIASNTWVIEHNLNKYPSVSLVDSAGTQFEAAVEYIDKNNVVVRMNGATTGKAFFN